MKTTIVEMSDQDFKRFADETGKIDFKTLQKRILADAFQGSINGAVREATDATLQKTLIELDRRLTPPA